MGAKDHCRIIHCTTGRIKAKNPAERLSFNFSKNANYRISRRAIVLELCDSHGGCPGLSVLTSLLASVDVKIYSTMLRHCSQLVPDMSADI